METKADWLRSEIEKLEGARLKYTPNYQQTEPYVGGYNQAITSIITRYKEELLELDKTNGF